MAAGDGALVFTQANHPDADSGVLLRAAARGDERSWNALVDRYSGLVWAIARNHRLSAADCDEVFQTTWLRLVEHAARVHDPAKVGGWLATTARHECLRILRRSGRQIPMGEDMPEGPDHAPAPDEDLLRGERDQSLWAAFARLPERDQALLRLLTADPAPSYEEIGAALDMPVGSIGPTRARCLERLRREAELPLLAAS
jgi:RNA polymerase sigma factor (sigma-70 family)